MSIMTIIVPADSNQSLLIRQTEGDLKILQTIVDGDIEAVGTGNCAIWLNDEGKLQGRPLNARATKLAHRLGVISADDAIVGDVAVTGFDDETGQNADAAPPILHFLAHVST